jgi:simple sugar transport system ATP-binding protein
LTGDYVVELRGISKIYSGSVKKANNSISLGLRRGEILCIAGENGAGKTTLMKILYGLEMPSAGEIFINGSAVTIDSPLGARNLGIGMVHQHFMLFPEYTVAENIVMGMEPRKWRFFFDNSKAKTEASKVIEAHGFSINPGKPVHSLSIGERQQVEICLLLRRNANIIILDEPTSVLTEQETAALFRTLKALALAGKSLFLITHKLREIKLIADRIAVLRGGGLVGICEVNEMDEYEISAMMAGNNTAIFPGEHKAKNRNTPVNDRLNAGKKVIVFDNVTVLRRGQQRPLLNKVSFSVRSGEIAGFTGVGGNGLGVLEAVLGGFLQPSSGNITHNNRDISRFNIRLLRKQGLAYIPSDRQRTGSALSATINENIIINRRHEFSRLGIMNNKAIKNFSAGLLNRYNITGTGRVAGSSTGSPADSIAAGDDCVNSLSGGNMQKLVLARELDCRRGGTPEANTLPKQHTAELCSAVVDQFKDYFVFSEPTWGLDINAGRFVWEEIIGLRDKGAAIIVISTNLDEILYLAGRIFVMYRGSAVAEFDNYGASIREEICNRMQGL